ADLLADHLPAAQADLPGPAAALDHLGLRRVHPGLPGHRRARQPGRVQPGHLRVRPGVHDAAELRDRVRAGPHPHGHPADHHHRLRPGLGPAGGDPMRLRSRTLRRAGLNVLGVLVALVTLFPILWMGSTAFKPAREIYSLTPPPLPVHPTLGNFRSVIDGTVIGLPYWNFLKNSLFVTLASVLASMLIDRKRTRLNSSH